MCAGALDQGDIGNATFAEPVGKKGGERESPRSASTKKQSAGMRVAGVEGAEVSVAAGVADSGEYNPPNFAHFMAQCIASRRKPRACR